VVLTGTGTPELDSLVGAAYLPLHERAPPAPGYPDISHCPICHDLLLIEAFQALVVKTCEKPSHKSKIQIGGGLIKMGLFDFSNIEVLLHKIKKWLPFG
jgi:hypothetical protein